MLRSPPEPSEAAGSEAQRQALSGRVPESSPCSWWMPTLVGWISFRDCGGHQSRLPRGHCAVRERGSSRSAAAGVRGQGTDWTDQSPQQRAAVRAQEARNVRGRDR